MAATHQTQWFASSKRPDWNTPAVVLDLVRKLGPIGLDPASNPASIVGAKLDYQLERGENGLAHSWRGHGLTWINPPYGPREIEPWTLKARREFSRDGNGVSPWSQDEAVASECVLLLPANTDTKWFHRDCAPADALCFWRGRIAFLGAPAGATFASLLVYWGNRPRTFREVFSAVGWCP